MASASVLQEFYKIRNEWEKVDILKNWRLAVWVLPYSDVEWLTNS